MGPMENRKFQMFLRNKAFSNKGSCELFCGTVQVSFIPLYPQELGRKHIAIEFILNAPRPPSTPASVFWIVYSSNLFLWNQHQEMPWYHWKTDRRYVQGQFPPKKTLTCFFKVKKKLKCLLSYNSSNCVKWILPIVQKWQSAI